MKQSPYTVYGINRTVRPAKGWRKRLLFRHHKIAVVLRGKSTPFFGGFFATSDEALSMRVALYARVSTHDQQTLPLQIEAMRQYVATRGWQVIREVTDISSGAKMRPEREALMKAARRREIDVVLVWRLDRWGRSLPDLIVSLKELSELGVGFLSLMEALDLTTSTGRAMAGLLAVFAEFERDILRERVKAGIAQSRAKGKPHGRPATTKSKQVQARRLFAEGKNKSQIARELGMSRSSVRALLASNERHTNEHQT